MRLIYAFTLIEILYLIHVIELCSELISNKYMQTIIKINLKNHIKSPLKY